MDIKKDALLNSLPIGILLLSIEHDILFINNTCRSLLDIEVDPCEYINIIKKVPELDDFLLKHKKDKISYNKKYILKNNIFCEISPYIDNNIQSGYIFIFKNIESLINSDNELKSKETRFTFDSIIGESPQIKTVINQSKQIASSPSTVLISGESGSGKELFAQSIHNYSPRRNMPFIALNCGAIPKNLIESELFGYESGSFTGANKGGSPGKFELADGGTLFLDEIGEMPIDMQVHLLRVLQEGRITRIGGKNSIEVDVRVIAATNKDLKDEIKKENFRSDLYYRLNVLPIKIPSLKDRIGDVPLLLDHFLRLKSLKLNKPTPIISQKLFKRMISYCWPGNIRELENFVENLVALNGITTYELDLEDCHCLTHDNLGNIIQVDSKENTSESHGVEDSIMPLIALEQAEIKKAICICQGNMTQVAKKLGISRNALYNKINRYNISVDKCKLK